MFKIYVTHLEKEVLNYIQSFHGNLARRKIGVIIFCMLYKCYITWSENGQFPAVLAIMHHSKFSSSCASDQLSDINDAKTRLKLIMSKVRI
jgi:hypothetical protein